MKKLVRPGRTLPVPSPVQDSHESRLFCAHARSLRAEAEGLSPGASCDESGAHRGAKDATR
jgi:hypothetical protein